MTAPRKPRGAIAPKPAPAAPLTATQLRAARLLAQMNDEAQSAVLDFMAGMAESCPRRARPVLRLVGGGAA